MKYFYGNSPFNIHAYVALRPLVLLFGHLVAWGGRIVVTDRQTDTHTHTQLLLLLLLLCIRSSRAVQATAVLKIVFFAIKADL